LVLVLLLGLALPLRSVAGDPAYAKIKARLVAKLAKLDHCKGRACDVAP